MHEPGRSSGHGPWDTVRRVRGVPLVGYPRVPGTPPVTVVRRTGRSAGGSAGGWGVPLRPHAHDFLVLLFVEHGAGGLRVDDRELPLRAGDAVLVDPGAVVGPAPLVESDAVAWIVFFPADAVRPAGAGPLVSWRGSPLLWPFAEGLAVGAHRLPVPPADRPVWLDHLTALEQELAGREDGHVDAARALLTLLLVRLARLAVDVPHGWQARREPLLAAVFDAIEARYHEPISLRDVAGAVGLSPAHVTTVVARRTGRSVQQWITERRMREARRLLADTDLTVEAVAARVGYRDAAYFTRRFRIDHGTPPATWRRAGGG